MVTVVIWGAVIGFWFWVLVAAYAEFSERGEDDEWE